MNAKEAIQTAKAYVAEVLADERVLNIGLEEIAYLDGEEVWEVTVGFSRPWDRVAPSTYMSVVNSAASDQARYHRTYKVVELSKDGAVIGMRNREVETADA